MAAFVRTTVQNPIWYIYIYNYINYRNAANIYIWEAETGKCLAILWNKGEQFIDYQNDHSLVD